MNFLCLNTPDVTANASLDVAANDLLSVADASGFWEALQDMRSEDLDTSRSGRERMVLLALTGPEHIAERARLIAARQLGVPIYVTAG